MLSIYKTLGPRLLVCSAFQPIKTWLLRVERREAELKTVQDCIVMPADGERRYCS